MAELGSLLSSTLGQQDVKVDVEMLDYGYIRECTDWKLVNAIVDVLKSGKEGYYPDLIRVAEERLLELLPSKEKKRYLSLSHKVTPDEVREAEEDVQNWMSSVNALDAKVCNKNVRSNKNLPAVRGSASSGTSPKEVEGSDPLLKEVQTSRNLGEAIDPEVESERKVFVEVVEKHLNKSQLRKLVTLRRELNVEMIAMPQRKYRAGNEKNKGNESFRVAENEIAVNCYSKSLALDASNSFVWANRAMAYIRMELFDLAEADCSIALALNPTYTKAFSRRGLVRFKSGKYQQAAQDFKDALKLDSNNVELQKLLDNALEKYRQVEGKSLDIDDAEDVLPEQIYNASPKQTQHSSVLHKTPISFVDSVSKLVFPDLADEDSVICVDSGVLSTVDTDIPTSVQTEQSFVRINVVSDDDDDDDDDEDHTGDVEQQQNFHRVAIGDSDEDDEEVPMPPAPPSNEEAAEELKERGNVSLKAGQVVEAVAAYSKSLELIPDYIPSLNNRAQAHLMLKDYKAAIADCNSVLRMDSKNLKALYRRGSALLAEGNITAAEQDVQALVQIDPNNSQAAKLKAQIASVKVETNTRKEPTMNVEKLKTDSQKHLANNEPESAVRLLSPLLRCVSGTSGSADEHLFSSLLPNDKTSLLHMLATAYSALGDNAHAAHTYDAILQIDSKNFRALLKRAEVTLLDLSNHAPGMLNRQQSLDSLSTVENDINVVLSIDPTNQAAITLKEKWQALYTSLDNNSVDEQTEKLRESEEWKEKGNAAMTAKDYSEAVSCYSRAIQNNTKNIAAYNNRALVHLKLMQYEKAEADASFVLENDAGEKVEVTNRRKKALCRRAQARRALGQQLLHHNQQGQHSDNVIKTFSINDSKTRAAAVAILNGALTDLKELQTLDENNKTCLSEMKAVLNWLNLCEKANEDSKIKSKKASSQKPVSSTQKSRTGTSPVVISSEKQASGSASFDELGMVARTSKKYKSAVASPTTAAEEEKAVEETEKIAHISPTQTPQSPSDKQRAPVASASKNRLFSPDSESVDGQSPQFQRNPEVAELPKTVYELERVWRSLKSRPDLFAKYISNFKKSTFKKVFKETVSPDLVSYMLASLQSHASPQNQIKALLGYSNIQNFTLQYSLLPKQDSDCIKSMFTSSIHPYISNLKQQEKQSKFIGHYDEILSVYGISL